MFVIANIRAASAISSSWVSASCRKIALNSAAPLACQNRAASVWSVVRTVLVSEPSRLTSLKSAA